MPLSIHIPKLKERITTQWDFANFSKWWNRKSDNGRQAETTSHHRIPSVRKVWRWRYYALPSKCLRSRYVLPSFGVEMDEWDLPWQQGTPKWGTPRETLSSRKRCYSSLNSARWFECLIANHSGHIVNLPGDGSHSSVADWRYPVIFTVDSPRDDKRTETSSFRFMFTIAPEALCTRARQLAVSRHGAWELAFLRICSGSDMDRTGWEHDWSGEQDHYLHENYADASTESSRLPCRGHVTSAWIVQCIMVHGLKLGRVGSKFLSIWPETNAKSNGSC
jgi:hypothetical protein